MQTETPGVPQPEQPEQPPQPTVAMALPAGKDATLAPTPPKPRGLGAAVTFDWALTAQLLIEAAFFVPGVGPGARLAGLPLGLRIGAAFVTAIGAAIVFAIGEALRRGWRPIWLFQIGFNSLLTVVGLVGLPGVIQEIGHPHRGLISDLVESIVLVIISPIIVSMLTRPVTRAWINNHTVAEALARHGLRWFLIVLPFVILGGAAIAFNGYY